MRLFQVFSLLLAISLIAACGGSGESAPQPDAGWSTARMAHFPAQGWRQIEQLSDSSFLVLSREWQGDDDVVTLRRISPDGASVSSYELLRSTNGRCCASPLGGIRVQADRFGGAFLAWGERLHSAPYRRLQVRYFSSVAGLGEQRTVLSVPGNAVTAFDMSVRPDGSALLGWIESTPDSAATGDYGPSAVFAAEIDRLVQYSTPKRISGEIPLAESGFLTLSTAVSTGGHGLVLWTNINNNSSSVLWASSASPNKSWSPPTLISRDTLADLETRPTISNVHAVLDKDGNGLASWQFENHDVIRVDYNALSATRGWSWATVLSTAAMNPVVGSSGSGRAFVAFLDRTQAPPARPTVRVASFDKGVFISALDLTPSKAGSNIVSSPQLSASVDGSVVVVWSEELSSTEGAIRSGRFSPMHGWAAPETVSRPGAVAPMNPTISAAQADRQTVFWDQYNFSTRDREVWFASRN